MDLFAGLRVRDFASARAWYERLLGGPPAFLPHDTEAVWELGEHRFVYIVEDADRAGSWARDPVPRGRRGAGRGHRERGIEPAERETYSNGVRKISYRDADGNEVGIGGGPE